MHFMDIIEKLKIEKNASFIDLFLKAKHLIYIQFEQNHSVKASNDAKRPSSYLKNLATLLPDSSRSSLKKEGGGIFYS